MTTADSQTTSSARGSAIIRFVPGSALFRTYRRAWLLPDILAGISVCVVMIPSVIAYSGLMGLPPQQGFSAVWVPLMVCACFGSPGRVIVGPDIPCRELPKQ